jgi:DNA-binding CsgD family transcriptional regulator
MPDKSMKALTSVFADYNITRAEMRLVKCLLLGYSNAVIAKHLKLTVGTVKFSLSGIYKKTAVRSRAEFIAKFQPQINAVTFEGPAKLIKQMELELANYRLESRTADDIKEAWPTFLKLIEVDPSSGAGPQMLESLLIALKLKKISG